MATVNYSSAQTAQIDQLKSYVEDYCQKNGIDPQTYTNYLDGNKAVLDPNIINDPVFQAYWQLAALQLNEIVNPSPLQSLSGEVGEVDFDALYATIDPETNDLIQKILSDDPELMALMTQMRGESPQTILKILDQKTPPPQIITEDEKSASQYKPAPVKAATGMNNFWDWLNNSQEGLEAVEKWALQGISDIDSYVASLDDLIASGQISPQEAQTMIQGKQADRAVLVLYMQKAEAQLNQQMEFFSSLLKSMSDAKNNIVRNFNVSA